MVAGKGQDRAVVEGQFSAQVDLYASDRACARRFPGLRLLGEWMGRQPDNRLRILELGGASGILLDELTRHGADNTFCCNIELTHAYASRQAHDRICFVQGSALDIPSSDETFDAVILRHVLHHLIGPDFTTTRRNQEQALSEAWRVVRPGGLLLIEEQTVEDPVACRILYTFSRWSSRLGLHIDALQIRPSVVVAFLTRRRLSEMIRVLGGNPVEETYHRRPALLRWRLTWLMRNTGDYYVAMQRRP